MSDKQEGIIFGMQAHTYIEIMSRCCNVGTTIAATVHTIDCPRGRPILAEAKDTMILDDDRAHFSFATVGSLRSQLCNFQKVFMPRGSHLEKEVCFFFFAKVVLKFLCSSCLEFVNDSMTRV